jgi:hypothetical protein
LVIISYTTGLSFALGRIGPLAAIITTVFYLLALYLFALPNTLENPFASIYSETLIKTTCQHILLLVGFNTLIYRKYYDTPLYLWVIMLQKYCSASGQRINMDKSSVFFSKGCSEQERLAIKNVLDVQRETLNEKYLGMPSDVGKSKGVAFRYLRDRVWKKVLGWLEQLLFVGGKEILIKSVAQAVPTYSMSCFKLPRGLCDHINSLISKFWWGSKEGKIRTSWVSWETMIQPKFAGGLGFRDIELFNLALLARQAWRLLQEPDSLSARVLKAVYYPEGDILSARLGGHPSQVWRSILEGRDALCIGLIRRIGDG